MEEGRGVGVMAGVGLGHGGLENTGGDLFGRDQMRFTFKVLVGPGPHCQFVRLHQPVRFRYGLLTMAPSRFNGIEPQTFARRLTDHEAHTQCVPLDLVPDDKPEPHLVRLLWR